MPRPADCAQCGETFASVHRSDGVWTKCCSKSCAQLLRLGQVGKAPGRDPEVRRASYRAKNYRRRARLTGDVTAEFERKLRAGVRKCPLCTVRMADAPFLPASKELDHIIPINIGGTHTVGNVRIICRLCNQKRPKDGSDFAGQPTLWATDPDVVVKSRKPKVINPTKVARVRKPLPPKPQPRPCKTCGVEIVPGGRGRPRSWCEDCRPSEYLMRKAAA